ncbi:SKP1-like protein 7 [Impatiens glandulifera]|uniref:SKP1-like protein 7 n=1 Tax=Impatiens glandulifera TaxID=253017 RepID=UPI001FB08C24|nr:SKP1-like protein 7 [Impatiens glandulifera]
MASDSTSSPEFERSRMRIVSDSTSSPEFENSKVVVVRSSDGVQFSILERVILMMNSLKHVVQHPAFAPAAGEVIPLENVDQKNLILVLKYCDHHSRPHNPISRKKLKTSDPLALRNAEMESIKLKQDKLKKFDYEFFNNITPYHLFPLLCAANDLQITVNPPSL